MSTDYFEDITGGREILGAHANASRQTWFTRNRRSFPWAIGSLTPPKARRTRKPGSAMIAWATGLLFALGAGLLAVSFAAQYRWLFRERAQHWPSLVEALALDVAMLIFSLLALGLARAGLPARAERVLILVCAFGSAGMNLAAADGASWRSVAAYVVPAMLLAIVADRVISVVRRHYLGDMETSAWQAAGHGAIRTARFAGLVTLYGLRLVLAPRSTATGGRLAVLRATPLPSAPEPPAIEPPRPQLRICSKCGLPIGRAGDGAWWSSGDAERVTPCEHVPFRRVSDDQDQDDDSQPWREPRPGTKTARFQAAVIGEHGPLAGIPLERVSPIASQIAPRPGIGLNAGTARSWLRRAVLAAQAPGEAGR